MVGEGVFGLGRRGMGRSGWDDWEIVQYSSQSMTNNNDNTVASSDLASVFLRFQKELLQALLKMYRVSLT